ncbi:thioredoxin family protein [Patescibacteria group bacterium]
MSLTPSTMIPLGTTAPDFSLPDINGKTVSLKHLGESQAYLIAFICVHCPYVKHLEKELAELGNEYQQKGVVIVAINSNDPDYDPEDSVEGMREQAQRLNFNFPYLVDESQDVARSYQAACTPDLYVFNSEKKLVYRGQFDDTRPGSGTPTGKDLKKALNAVINGNPVELNQKPSSGCNIKWKN